MSRVAAQSAVNQPHANSRAWHCAVEPLRDCPPPLDVFRAVASEAHVFLRHASGGGARGTPWSFLSWGPTDVTTVRTIRSRRTLERALDPLRPDNMKGDRKGVPFIGGWAGVLGYEARSGIESKPKVRRSPLGFPALWFGFYQHVVAWNHRSNVAFVCTLGANERDAAQRLRRIAKRVAKAKTHGKSMDAASPPNTSPQPAVPRNEYTSLIRAAKQAVLRGDIFQSNISQRFDARVHAPPHVLFERLAESQPAPYMTYLELGDDRAILSASPERFLRVRGRTVETDPMKGTRPRGKTRKEDRELRRALEMSEKDRAELAMIVDLSRNDLARSCTSGTIRVLQARKLIRFARVHQAIGVVQGRLRKGLDRIDALIAAFPPGSVTGAPKVRAMEIIDELEGEGRGPYCGALGWLDAAGGMDLSVAIRTILVSGSRATYRVGGGITLASDPVDEWRETLDKGKGLFAALAGREDPT